MPLNLRGAAAAVRALVRDPQLLLPQLSVRDASEVPFEALKARGFEAVVFDRDNTLTPPRGLAAPAHIAAAVADCQRVFGAERVAVWSNSAGSSDDVDFADAQRLEAALGLRVLRHGGKKPLGGAAGARLLGVADASRVVVVGDRLATDVLLANLHGMLAVRTEPLEPERALGAAWLLRLEGLAARLLARRGVRAPTHSLWPDAE